MRMSSLCEGKPVVMSFFWSRERVLESCRPDNLTLLKSARWVEEMIS